MGRKEDTCEVFCFNPEAVEQVRSRMLLEDEVTYMADIFKVLGDRTRIRVLQALLQKELCVCDLSVVLDLSTSAISHQLRVLRNARLVKNRREGKNVYYTIDDGHVALLFKQALEHVRHY